MTTHSRYMNNGESVFWKNLGLSLWVLLIGVTEIFAIPEFEIKNLGHLGHGSVT